MTSILSVVDMLPAIDPEQLVRKAEIVEALRQADLARSITVKDDASAQEAATALVVIKSGHKALKDALAPLREQIRRASQMLATVNSPLDVRLTGAEITLKNQLLAYRKQQAQAREAEMTAARIAAELEAKDGAPALDTYLPPASDRVDTGLGTVFTRRVLKVQVLDPGLIPERFKVVDTAALIRYHRDTREPVPGARFYEEESATVRTT